MIQVKVFVTDRRTEGQTDGRMRFNVPTLSQKRVTKSKIWYPVKLFDIWIPQTVTGQKLEVKLLRYVFAKQSHIESMYCIETGRR